MPLKVVTRAGSSTYYIRGLVQGKRIFESTRTSDPKRAEDYRAKREAELWTESIYGTRAVVTFADAVKSYMEAEERSDATKAYMRRLLIYFGTTRLHDINQSAVDRAYKHILRDGMAASPATKIRSVLTPLRAVLEFAAIRQWCDRPAFDAPKVRRTRSVFLKPSEATCLVVNAAPHLRPILIFLIGTGARMSEAMELQWKHVDLRARRAVLWQKQGFERHVDLPEVVVRSMDMMPHREGPVFQTHKEGGYADRGRLSGGQIKSGWSYACRRAGFPGHMRVWVPKGQKKEKQFFVPDVTPHDLRHTWATWHYCVHKDIIKLRDDGGWSTISIVTHYAKKMPDAYRSEILNWWGAFPLLFHE
ncbi:site-specific integrase [Komagataeibacter medellinensis]|uniref:Site-specific integrase n=1 Tax=Komagataeibacter medellinensis TaxID=1177712 RepID=A0ABQ6VR48_9PROT|nr:site-specific integrase [Komagataeibacter medellinensis]KAB8122422.1 site-specific integrase [Komagataeibacter medellinensis]